MNPYCSDNLLLTWPVSCRNTTWVNSPVHLPIRDQFTFSNTTPDCVCTLTRPLFLLFFFQTPEVTIIIFPFSAVFLFIDEILANVVIFTWVSLCLSKHRNFSDSTGTVWPLFIFADYVPFTKILFKYVTRYILFFNYAPVVICFFKHDPWLTQLFTHSPWLYLTYSITSPILFIFMHTPLTVIFVQLHYIPVSF